MSTYAKGTVFVGGCWVAVGFDWTPRVDPFGRAISLLLPMLVLRRRRIHCVMAGSQVVSGPWIVIRSLGVGNYYGPVELSRHPVLRSPRLSAVRLRRVRCVVS